MPTQQTTTSGAPPRVVSPAREDEEHTYRYRAITEDEIWREMDRLGGGE